MHWRPIGNDGDPWPAWLRVLGSRCGVYAIRKGRTVLYVGSSRSRLYDTITRHFQRWHRNKRFWKGLHGAGHDPGMTYPRAGHEVAILTTACGDHLHVEAAWIDELAPRDNLVKAPDGELEDAPF